KGYNGSRKSQIAQLVQILRGGSFGLPIGSRETPELLLDAGSLEVLSPSLELELPTDHFSILRALHLLLPSILKGTSRFLCAQTQLLGLICREPHGIGERLNVLIGQMFGGDAGTQLLKLILREASG